LSDAPDTKVGIITGAGSGIGLACARRLAADGHHLVLVEQAIGLVADVRLEADTRQMAQTALEQFTRIDYLIASAGVLRPGGELKTVAETSLDDWRFVVDTNLTGTFLSNQAVLPAMMQQRVGDIINISSVSGRKGQAFDATYCATKFGIIGLSESLAEEVRNFGIRVQTILPDAVDTPLWEQNGPAVMRAPVTLPPERIADVIAFMLNLPRDAYLMNPVVGTFRSGRRRKKNG
jgi:NAD(P)-dependent dehydrogenase (short-subunit alcohol dehydrogenase family)